MLSIFNYCVFLNITATMLPEMGVNNLVEYIGSLRILIMILSFLSWFCPVSEHNWTGALTTVGNIELKLTIQYLKLELESAET